MRERERQSEKRARENASFYNSFIGFISQKNFPSRSYNFFMWFFLSSLPFLCPIFCCCFFSLYQFSFYFPMLLSIWVFTLSAHWILLHAIGNAFFRRLLIFDVIRFARSTFLYAIFSSYVLPMFFLLFPQLIPNLSSAFLSASFSQRKIGWWWKQLQKTVKYFDKLVDHTERTKKSEMGEKGEEARESRERKNGNIVDFIICHG